MLAGGIIADKTRRHYGLEIDPAREITVVCGATEGMAAVLLALVDPGDEVIVFEPYYENYHPDLQLCGATRKLVTLHAPDWGFDADELRRAFSGKTKAIIINSPNNPTGAAAPLAFSEQLAERCRRHGVVLASDEAYSEIYLGDDKPASVLELADPTHILAFNSLSKRSAMAGYRSGAVCGDPLLIGAMKDVRPSLGVTPQNFVQRASIAAWNDDSHVDGMRERYALKREIMVGPLEAAGYKSVGGPASFFLWCEVGEGGDDQAAARRLLEAGVLVAPGRIFGPGGEGYVRVALVQPIDQCELAAEALLALGR